MSHFESNLHLMWRAGFGPATSQLQQLHNITSQQLFKALQKESATKPDFIDAADNYLQGLMMGIGDAAKEGKKLDEENRKMVQQKQRESIKNLNLLWLTEMVNSKAQLREKMALFWHGHFASRNLNVFYQQDLLHIIRSNALGSFRDLLHEVSKSAAMLNFLNAAQNRKDHPNENFAREVMELFTLGRGHYTENDIKEAARAFTGWSANLKGEFVFRRFQHDFGNKTIFGKTGAFEGEDVLDMLLERKETASFITLKVYRFFVNENADMEKVDWLARRFYQNDYNISKLLEDIFTSNWFYDAKNRGTRIKSPIELLTGMQRMLPMELQNEEALLLLQRILGQVLFYPPNVAGWPGGKTWIDSSTLMTRLRIPQMLNDQDELNIRPKDDDDRMMGRQEEKGNEMQARKAMGRFGKQLKAEINWNDYTKNFESIPREKLLTSIAASLLPSRSIPSADLIKAYADSSSREGFIKTATLHLMSTPEYQMC
ncbi:DUF1800 domain-containing protein [Chitinophagaceae bacterium LB-8]|uniref:DUF1800 domain-containing protein n=1 Tax=Paraflavisolibacter caeni TaxID=2982496 RepID=A0A9X2XYF0_9BACT|nr:DUF1800 domain-containing protein [Paraflavisolibacter caeni]MCU7550922.1 DUF1800 domain-containing protein [Paraflavisolibacter caeni]